MTRPFHDSKGEVLVAILPKLRDFDILQNEGWYRIPVKSAPRRWPPRWLAFYQTKIFGDERYAIRYFGEVAKIETVSRFQLFPNELSGPNRNKRYHKVTLSALQQRPIPLQSHRPRRLVFVPTTWAKFSLATEFNDIFDDSPLEDRLWQEFKKRAIPAERQWLAQVGKDRYRLDFAVFCHQGNIDVETDGDTYHIGKVKGQQDNLRNNAIEVSGWHVLRFNTNQIQEELLSYCVPKVVQAIDRFGGLKTKSYAPRRFYTTPKGVVEQPSLLDFGSVPDEEELGDEDLE